MTGEHVAVRERLGWLRRTMAVWILAVVLLVVALTVGVTATLGLFSGASTNPTNVVTSGSMSQSNSAGNAAIMRAEDLVPGESVDGTVSIANLGDATGEFRLAVDELRDEPGAGGGRLSRRLQLEVVDLGTDEQVYAGPLGDLSVDLGTWAPDDEHSYLFTALLPQGAAGVDDDYQGSTVTVTFVWSGVQGQ